MSTLIAVAQVSSSYIRHIEFIWYARALLGLTILVSLILMLIERLQSARAEADVDADATKWAQYGRNDDPGNPFN